MHISIHHSIFENLFFFFYKQCISLPADDFLRLIEVLSTQVFCYPSKQLPVGQANFWVQGLSILLFRQLETILCRSTSCLARCNTWGQSLEKEWKKRKVTVLYYYTCPTKWEAGTHLEQVSIHRRGLLTSTCLDDLKDRSPPAEDRTQAKPAEIQKHRAKECPKGRAIIPSMPVKCQKSDESELSFIYHYKCQQCRLYKYTLFNQRIFIRPRSLSTAPEEMSECNKDKSHVSWNNETALISWQTWMIGQRKVHYI